MEVIGVAYHWTPARQTKWQHWAVSLNAELTLLHTHPDRADQATYAGNTHFEFGAYAVAAHFAQTEGPYILVNDTLLDTHAYTLWAVWLRHKFIGRAVRSSPPDITRGIYADLYPAPRERPVEIPDPYASSWIFYLATRGDLEVFCNLVEQVIDCPGIDLSKAYTAFLNRWMNSFIPWVGYQGPRQPDDLARKRQTIIWEHRLSYELRDKGLLHSFNGLAYHILRIFDKVLRRIYSSPESRIPKPNGESATKKVALTDNRSR